MFTQNMIHIRRNSLMTIVILIGLFLGIFCLACEESDPEEDDRSDCGDLCRKVQECADLGDFDNNFEDLPQCIGRCKDVDTDSTLSCMFECSIRLECDEYEACLLDC